MALFSSKGTPKICKGWGWRQLAVHTDADIFVIDLRGLRSLSIEHVVEPIAGENEQAERYALIAVYDGKRDAVEVAGFRTFQAAMYVQKRVFKSLGFKLFRFMAKALAITVGGAFVFSLMGALLKPASHSSLTVSGASPALTSQNIQELGKMAMAMQQPGALSVGGPTTVAQGGTAAAPQDLEAAREVMKAKLKAEAGNLQDFVPENYTFNPKIEVASPPPPELKCANKTAKQALQQSSTATPVVPAFPAKK